MEHEQHQQATQINAANQPARRYSRRLAGLEADPPTELKKVRAKQGAPKSQRKRSRKQAHPCRFIKEEAPPSDGPKGPEAIPLTAPPSDEAAQKLEMGNFWNDPLFETTLTRLDDLSGDSSPPPSTSNARVL